MKTLYDTKTQITYEISSELPKITCARSPLTVRMLSLYSMYRNGLYDTRIIKPLDADIAAFKPRFDYEHEQDSLGVNNNLYHYAAYIGLDAMQENYLSKKIVNAALHIEPLAAKKPPLDF